MSSVIVIRLLCAEEVLCQGLAGHNAEFSILDSSFQRSGGSHSVIKYRAVSRERARGMCGKRPVSSASWRRQLDLTEGPDRY